MSYICYYRLNSQDAWTKRKHMHVTIHFKAGDNFLLLILINLSNPHHAFCIIKNSLPSILKSAIHEWSNTVKIWLGLHQFLLKKGDISFKGGFIFNVLTQWWITMFLRIKLLLLRWLRHVILMISCKFLGFPVHILASSIDEVSPRVL